MFYTLSKLEDFYEPDRVVGLRRVYTTLSGTLGSGTEPMSSAMFTYTSRKTFATYYP